MAHHERLRQKDLLDKQKSLFLNYTYSLGRPKNYDGTPTRISPPKLSCFEEKKKDKKKDDILLYMEIVVK